MLNLIDVTRSFGAKEVLRGVTFKLPEGTIGGLIGPSGVGKSALLKILAGVDRADSGTAERGQGDLSLMFQEGALFDSLSVFDNVAFPLTGGRVPVSTLRHSEIVSVHEKVQSILSKVGLAHAAYKMPGQLSGGMRRRVSLARALVIRPKILLLDDPTSGLDPVASSVIMKLVVGLHAEYRPTLLIVSHDLRRLLPVLERVYALFDGKIIYDGSVSGLSKSAEQGLVKFVACRYDLHECRATAESPPSDPGIVS